MAETSLSTTPVLLDGELDEGLTPTDKPLSPSYQTFSGMKQPLELGYGEKSIVVGSAVVNPKIK